MAKAVELAKRARQDIDELTQVLEGATVSEKKEPKAATKATQKWQEKTGLAPKTYKLKTELTEAFAAKCEAEGRTQAAVLSELMAAYVAGERPVEGCWLCKILRKLGRV